jgi:hypothetical protein
LRVENGFTDVASFKNVILTADGSRTIATENDQSNQYPYYYKDGSPEKWNGEYFLQRFSTIAPPFKSGESLVFRDSIDVKQSRQAWQYLVGQRRVRRAPTVAYDTPDFVLPAPTTLTRCWASRPCGPFRLETDRQARDVCAVQRQRTGYRFGG